MSSEQGFWPQYSRADIVRRGLDAGLSQTEIAAILGVSRPALHAWIKSNGDRLAKHQSCDPRAGAGVITRKLLTAGASVSDVQSVTGAKQAAVTNIRSRAGIRSRYDYDRDAMIAEYRSGVPAKVVAQKYGITVASVYTHACTYGRRKD